MPTNDATKKNYFEGCNAASSIAIVGWAVFGVGMISNSLLLYFVLKKLAAGKRNDKLFLLNIIITNFLSLLGSLIPELLSRGQTLPSIQEFCTIFNLVNFITLFTNLTSMAALCYDRFENVTKYPGQRSLSFRKSVKIVVVGWVLAILLVSGSQSGFFVAYAQGHCICEYSNKTPALPGMIGFFAVIVTTTTWIAIHAQIIRQSLWGIYSKLKQHRKETEQILGKTNTIKEVNLKKQASAMVTCYFVCWGPLSVAGVLTLTKLISFHSCFFFGCLVATHISAATTPLIYLTLDKRFRFKFGTSRKQGAGPTPRVSP